jgi:hypothetical protein
MKTAEERAIRKRMRRLQDETELEVIRQVNSEMIEQDRRLALAVITDPRFASLGYDYDDPEGKAKWEAFITTFTPDQQAAYQKFEARILQLAKERGVSFD